MLMGQETAKVGMVRLDFLFSLRTFGTMEIETSIGNMVGMFGRILQIYHIQHIHIFETWTIL